MTVPFVLDALALRASWDLSAGTGAVARLLRGAASAPVPTRPAHLLTRIEVLLPMGLG